MATASAPRRECTLSGRPDNIHLIRNTFRLASRRDWDAIKWDIKPGYTAVNAEAARAAMDQAVEVWGGTNAIESLNARYRRAIKARGHFPSEQAALKCLYLVTRSLDPTGTGKTRWAMGWKPALNAFAVTFGDRFPAAETY
jgi:transposase-like protein